MLRSSLYKAEWFKRSVQICSAISAIEQHPTLWTMAQRINHISDTLKSIIPNPFVGVNANIIVTNYLSDRSHYVDTSKMYCSALLPHNHGINRCLSKLYISVCGLHGRTSPRFFGTSFSVEAITYIFPHINKVLFNTSFSFLKRKFEAHTYWSTLYLNKYPCRGQRRRTNASTAHKLNLVYKLNSFAKKA